MAAYYNEFDANAAQWLRELIKLGLIADGEVDDRSILEVTPNDLKDFTQCHFFAGIGVWSHALRQAGISDDTEVWTGSAPCQPFSSAGKGAGVDDERHLWPAFHWLIKQCRPDLVFGEQVAHKAGAAWFDIVSTDLEGEDYTCGKIVLPACGLGAPHLRVRQYWVAHTKHSELSSYSPPRSKGRGATEPRTTSDPLQLEDASSHRRSGQRPGGSSEEGRQPRPEQSGELPRGSEGRSLEGSVADTPSARQQKRDGKQGDEPGEVKRPERLHSDGELGDPQSERCGEERGRSSRPTQRDCGGSTPGELADANGLRPEGQRRSGEEGTSEHSEISRPGPTNGFWGDADWLLCRDGKWRPVESGTFPLADGSPSELVCSGDLGTQDVESTKEARTMRLKGYGNAIVAQQATAFIEAAFECIAD